MRRGRIVDRGVIEVPLQSRVADLRRVCGIGVSDLRWGWDEACLLGRLI